MKNYWLEGFIKNRLAELDQDKARIDRERSRLNAALEAFHKVEEYDGEIAVRDTGVKERLYRGESQTIKGAIVKILEFHPSGLSGRDIVNRVNEYLSKDYLRHSISPQLSRLRYEKVIDLDKGIWKLILNIESLGKE